jgi:hypothetical protein
MLTLLNGHDNLELNLLIVLLMYSDISENMKKREKKNKKRGKQGTQNDILNKFLQTTATTVVVVEVVLVVEVILTDLYFFLVNRCKTILFVVVFNISHIIGISIA